MAEQHQAPEPDAWAGARVERWVAMADRLDAQMAPITDLLVAATGLRAGDRVLDVGCGTGPIARKAANIVGPQGLVIGVDISAEMVAAAREATPAAGAATSAPVRYVHADATTWKPTSTDFFDVVMSRFGVMFFDDPSAAFANLAALTRPLGRLSTVVWDRRDRSELFEVPLSAAVEVLTAAGHEPDVMPPAGGPFSLSDPTSLTALLENAGWHDVSIRHEEVDMLVGGGTDPGRAAEDAFSVGPTRQATEGIDDALRAQVRAAMETRLRDHVDADGHVVLRGQVLVVTAAR